MPGAGAEQKDIRELQSIAQSAPAYIRQVRKHALSRAAQLEAVDMLSRWSAGGLALIAGIGVYLSVTVGRALPGRAAAWALMLLGALWVCRRMQSRFRAGDETTGRPFRWRASFAACLSVLGVAFASAPILLTPEGAETSLVLQTFALSFIGAFGAACFLIAHANSAAAIILPAIVLPLMAALRNGSVAQSMAYLTGALIATAAIYTAHRMIRSGLDQRHPRTGLLRSEIETPDTAKAPGADHISASA
ncbi:MAG: hypothetical protein AAGD92_08685 [Pseudomonadota bacterium]